MRSSQRRMIPALLAFFCILFSSVFIATAAPASAVQMCTYDAFHWDQTPRRIYNQYYLNSGGLFEGWVNYDTSEYKPINEWVNTVCGADSTAVPAYGTTTGSLRFAAPIGDVVAPSFPSGNGSRIRVQVAGNYPYFQVICITGNTNVSGNITYPDSTQIFPSGTPYPEKSVTFNCSGYGGLKEIRYYGKTTGSPTGGGYQDVNNNSWMTFRPDGSPDLPPKPAPIVTEGNCIFDAQRIALVAAAAGFTGLDLQKAVAIALAESGGKVNALHLNTNGSYDIGLWQINDAAHPSYDTKQLGINPFYNATAAKEIYVTAGNKFTPWVTYNTSRYVNFMSAAKTAIDANNGDSAALSNCSGAIATDSSGNPVTTPGTNSYCGFSINPLDYLKCLFIPSPDSFKQWNTLQGNMQTKPPFSVVTAAISFAGGAFGGNYVSPTTGQTCYDSDPASCANGQNTNFSLPNSAVTYNFNPITAIGEKAKAASSYQKILGILNLALWLAFIFYAFNRISRSFGSKESAVSE